MKLRTVLSELCVTEHVEGTDVDLEQDVFTYPSSDFNASFEQLLVLAPEGATEPPAGHVGLTLVYCGSIIPDRSSRPGARTIYCTTDQTFDELKDAFSRLPERHVYLDLQRKRVYAAFQSSYDIQRFADKVFEVLGNPLMIVNSDHRLVASAGSFPENRADVIEEITQGYVSEDVNVELETAGILDDVRRAGHSIISENKRFGQR